MNLLIEELSMNLNSCINQLAIVSRAIASTQTTSNNLNYIIVGLVVVIVILVIATMKGNSKKISFTIFILHF